LPEITFRDGMNRVVLLRLVKLYKEQKRYEEAIQCLKQLRPLEIAFAEARYNERNRSKTDPDPKVVVKNLESKMDKELDELQKAASSSGEGAIP
jgi:MinD-like ATPase involved in chromosome partitioning or flagellar assembly